MFNLKKMSNYFPGWLYHFTVLPAMYERFNFSVSLLAFSIATFYVIGSDRCLERSHYNLTLYFNEDWWCWTYFHVLICHPYNIFSSAKFFFMSFVDFLTGLLFYCSFKSSLHIGYESFVWYVVCWYFLQVCNLLFYLFNRIFHRANVYNFS